MNSSLQPQSEVSAASADTLSSDAPPPAPPPPPPPPPVALPVDPDCIEQTHQAAQQQNMNRDVRLDDSDEDDDGGDIDSSDEEYNQRNFGIYQALPVDGEPDWSLSE
jgi:hypothetical protein